MKSESLEGKSVIVTGGGSGIGRAAALLFAERGACVTVADVSPDTGEAVAAEMAGAGPAGRAFREFALGFHPLRAVPEENQWVPYYGYGAGVVRLSLGDNSELGGNVRGGYVRWNFFTDTTVTIDGDLWVSDGKIVK